MQTLIDVLLHGNQLKRTARTGWVQRGVPDAEDVAAHSYGVAFTTLILTQVVGGVEVGKALTMALLHDLPEGLTSDIPPRTWRLLPAGSKIEAEQGAMQSILGAGDSSHELMVLWQEYQTAETVEAQLVHDADKIDLFLQALVYEEQTGNQYLQEFWDNPADFHFPETQALYEALRRQRAKSQHNP